MEEFCLGRICPQGLYPYLELMLMVMQKMIPQCIHHLNFQQLPLLLLLQRALTEVHGERKLPNYMELKMRKIFRGGFLTVCCIIAFPPGKIPSNIHEDFPKFIKFLLIWMFLELCNYWTRNVRILGGIHKMCRKSWTTFKYHLSFLLSSLFAPHWALKSLCGNWNFRVSLYVAFVCYMLDFVPLKFFYLNLFFILIFLFWILSAVSLSLSVCVCVFGRALVFICPVVHCLWRPIFVRYM